LSWKLGVGARPDGAFDGNGFTVTPPMMSILGANADDMEEILKGLGYRSDARPAAAVKARIAEIDEAARVAAVKAEAEKAVAQAGAAAAVDTVPVADGETAHVANQGQAVEQSVPADPASDEQAQEEPSASGQAREPVAGTTSVANEAELAAAAGQSQAAGGEGTAPVSEAPAREPTEADTADVTAVASKSTEAASPAEVAEAASIAEAPAAAEEPKPILIWRPARFEQRPRHRHEARGRDGARHAEARKPGAADGDGGAVRAPGDGEAGQRPSGKGRFERKFGGKPGRRDSDQKDGKDRGRRKGGPDSPDGAQKGDRVGGAAAKSWTTQKPREERPVRVDPDSPFAKLAALRDQLKK
jgi:ATP-dependent RNA helicase SUPV3L1/SUV3